MTYIQLINKVLLKLRESEATTPTQSSYISLIGQFLNETKREVEDAYNWLELRATSTVITQPDIFRYTLEDVGSRFRMLDVFNDTDDYMMRKAPDAWMNRIMNFTDTQSGRPFYFTYNTTTNGDPDVDLWPIPDAAYSINFNMVVPQPDLVASGDILLVPEYPVYLGAYAKAVSERGEDSGRTYNEAMSEYKQALDDAIGLQLSRTPYEDSWVVV